MYINMIKMAEYEDTTFFWILLVFCAPKRKKKDLFNVIIFPVSCQAMCTLGFFLNYFYIQPCLKCFYLKFPIISNSGTASQIEAIL